IVGQSRLCERITHTIVECIVARSPASRSEKCQPAMAVLHEMFGEQSSGLTVIDVDRGQMLLIAIEGAQHDGGRGDVGEIAIHLAWATDGDSAGELPGL